MIWSIANIANNLLNENVQLAALFYQATSAAVVIMDADYKIIQINPAFSETTGYSLVDLMNNQMTTVFDLLKNYSYQQDIVAALNAKGYWRGELSVRQMNSDYLPVLAMINSVVQADKCVSHYVALLLDITERKQLEYELRHDAEIDPLTGLANRKLFFQRLDDAIASARHFNYKLAILFLDLDGFKQINDNLGHAQGDNVLIEIAHRLRRCVREVDTVARLGGDEFALILNGTSKDVITDTAQRIVDTTAFTIDEQNISLPISVSVGISLYPEDSANPQTLLKFADAAMYSAKFKGKRQCCWHT
ncbi:sensor domain-containing diguanylate cyclase [Methylocucumis oryzae]|uniref:sensor domain-containing diguanylate cyclase n=1 Tax=Methylocucumis oryzae TaxID=1632867 RepID=UPI0006978554|nr:sensor domain-containing diguanylate cyclase [Methylocucumis oryzae]